MSDETTIWERCPSCRGHGLENGIDGPRDCGSCQGEGRVRARDESGRFTTVPL